MHQKATFYRELGQLLHSGTAFPAAIKLLMQETSGAFSRFLTRLLAAVNEGSTVGEAFRRQSPAISRMEATVVEACARSGRLDQGCSYLFEHFTRLENARRFIIKKSLYPLFVLHAAVFVPPLPALVIGGNFDAYLRSTAGFLILVYLYGAAIAILVFLLIFEANRSSAVDRFLLLMPGFGKMRRAFALSRFCATYEMQLQSGVNVVDSLISAGNASHSALVGEAVRMATPEIRGGAQVSPLLAKSRAFTRDMMRAMRIGEETGELDRELKRLSEEFQQEAVNRLERLTALFSKTLYYGVVLYAAHQIAAGYASYLDKAVNFAR